MTSSKQLPKIKPSGPEDKFKDRLPGPYRFQSGSRNVADVDTTRNMVLKVERVRTGSTDDTGGFRFPVPKIDFSASFDIGYEGIAILIGRLNRSSCGIVEPDVVARLIDDPERVHEIVAGRIEHIRGKIVRRNGSLEEQEALFRTLTDPDSQDTLKGEAARVYGRISRLLHELSDDVGAVKRLKEMLSEGRLIHVLHVFGGTRFSSTNSILSIKPGELTFIPLQNEWGTPINAQTYELGYDTPPHDVRLSIEFPK